MVEVPLNDVSSPVQEEKEEEEKPEEDTDVVMLEKPEDVAPGEFVAVSEFIPSNSFA